MNQHSNTNMKVYGDFWEKNMKVLSKSAEKWNEQL